MIPFPATRLLAIPVRPVGLFGSVMDFNEAARIG
jgi:hypothetical protein